MYALQKGVDQGRRPEEDVAPSRHSSSVLKNVIFPRLFVRSKDAPHIAKMSKAAKMYFLVCSIRLHQQMVIY